MNAFRFWLAKTMGDEAVLSQLGATEDELLADLAGRHVALVGNARGLADGANGEAIDAADIVIRMNGAPIPHVRSHGARTDWLGVSVAVPPKRVEERAPQRLIWVTPKRKRLPLWMARDPRFALYPAARHAELASGLGGRPTTGLLLLDLVAASQAACITLWGFDFFATQSLSGRRSVADVPHDFTAEAAYVAALAASDSRLRQGGVKPP
jgi:hypothetical protein